MPSSESGNRALRYKIPEPRSVARPSIIRQRRSDRICGKCARSTPARLSPGQCANDKFSPTATKYDRPTGDCTAIIRQFAQSAPNIEGSIWSRRGNLPSRAFSVQSRSTRSTRRRLKTTFTVSETMSDIVSDTGNITAATRSPSVAGLCASVCCLSRFGASLYLNRPYLSVNIDLTAERGETPVAGADAEVSQRAIRGAGD